MKIDYSHWVINKVGTTFIEVFNKVTNKSISVYLDFYSGKIDDKLTDDPIKDIKELCKKEIRRVYFMQQLNDLANKQMPLVDNLEYLEEKYDEQNKSSS